MARSGSVKEQVENKSSSCASSWFNSMMVDKKSEGLLVYSFMINEFLLISDNLSKSRMILNIGLSKMLFYSPGKCVYM